MGLFGIGKKFNNNSYGIDKKSEWKGENGIKDELKNNPLFSGKLSEIKSAIKHDKLGAEMDNMSKDMQNALGLSLLGKVDGAETIEEAKKTLAQIKLSAGPDGKLPDKAKVLQYIIAADAARIEKNQTSFNEGYKDILNTNTANNATKYFATSPLIQGLDKEFALG